MTVKSAGLWAGLRAVGARSHRFQLIAAALVGLGFSSVAGMAHTQSAPANTLETAPLVTPTTALQHYGPSTSHTNGVAAWAASPPEIQALARALGANRLSATQYTQNVFDYVRNNIAVEFRFGLGKGGRGALIDQSGTPFDQAELMVKLLRQGNVTSSYNLGTITLTPQQFGQWSGLVNSLNQSAQTFNVDARAACQYLADGGIPATVNGASSCSGLTGNLTTVTMTHVWVSANGNVYDPSFKRNLLKTGVDVAAAIGCGSASAPTCASTAKSSVFQGSSSGTLVAGVPYVQNLNEAGLLGSMDTLAKGLQTTIATSDRTQHVSDVIGGAQTDTTFSPAVGSTLTYPFSRRPRTGEGTFPTSFERSSPSPTAERTSIFTPMKSAVAASRLFHDRQFNPEIKPTSCTSTTLRSSSVRQASRRRFDPAKVTHPYAANSGTYASDSITVPVAGLTPRPPRPGAPGWRSFPVDSQILWGSPGARSNALRPLRVVFLDRRLRAPAVPRATINRGLAAQLAAQRRAARCSWCRSDRRRPGATIIIALAPCRWWARLEERPVVPLTRIWISSRPLSANPVVGGTADQVDGRLKRLR